MYLFCDPYDIIYNDFNINDVIFNHVYLRRFII